MKIRKTIAFLLTAALLLTALPVSFAKPISESDFTVPEGYNEHDYMCCVGFLEQEDRSG